MRKVYIYHHLGMGDHFLCNGFVRYFAAMYDKTYVFAKPKWKENVEYMYRDNPHIIVIAKDDRDIRFWLQALGRYEDVKMVGHTHDYIHHVDHMKDTKFNTMYYLQHKLDPRVQWTHYYFERDMEREKAAFEKLGLKEGDEYLFVHEEPDRFRKFDDKYVDRSKKIINPNEHLDIPIFDFIYTAEKAQEVHVHSSGFSCFFDSMKLKHNKLFFHHYISKDERSGLLPHYDHFLHPYLEWKFLF